jgi:hypothetical protein
MIDNLGVSLLLVPVWVLALGWWWQVLRSPRRRCWREDRESMRTHARMREALR